MIMWVIGVSGAGKSVLAGEIHKLAGKTLPNLVLVDGDTVREIFDNDLGHSMEDRRKNADRLSRLCLFLERQGIHVVAAVASAFEETRKWNRKNFTSYFEVYVKTPLPELLRRDPKGLYARALNGEIGLPGVNQPYEEPTCPDKIIINDGSLKNFLAHAPELAGLLCGNDQR